MSHTYKEQLEALYALAVKHGEAEICVNTQYDDWETMSGPCPKWVAEFGEQRDIRFVADSFVELMDQVVKVRLEGGGDK